MNTIIVTTQAEWDALPTSFDTYTRVEIRSSADVWLSVSKIPESSHVVARGSSHVEAWESSHVEARESSHVVAWGSSHVVAWGSSHVVAWGSSHVEAWGSSHVEAWESVAVHVRSPHSAVDLFGFAVAILLVAGTKIVQKAATTTVVRPETKKGAEGWLDNHAIEPKEDKVVVYKRVSTDLKTQEGKPNETLWSIGATLEHPKWNPARDECGVGKFHAVARPFFGDEFRSNRGDRYIAIEVAIADLYAWDDEPEYPHKIAFRKGTVLHECDRYGKKIEEVAT